MMEVVLASQDLSDGLDEQVFAPQVDSTLPHLNDAHTLEGLVRDFAGEVLETRGAWVDGELTDTAAAARVTAAARKLNGILLGEDHGYWYDSWNTPTRLGAALRHQFALECTPAEAPLVMLLALARRVCDSVDLGATGEIPSYLVANRLETGIAGLRDAFLGLDLQKNAQVEAGDKLAASLAVALGMRADKQESQEAQFPQVVFGAEVGAK